MRNFIKAIFLSESWNIGEQFLNLGTGSNWFILSDEQALNATLSALGIKDADRFQLPAYVLVHDNRPIMVAGIDQQTGKINHSALQGGHAPDAGWSRFTLALEQKLSGEDRLQEGEGREDFYELRKTLKPGDVFRDFEGDIVKLENRVEGDGTKWEVAVWTGQSWSFDGNQIEPGDLVSRAEDPQGSIKEEDAGEVVAERAPPAPSNFLRVDRIMHKIIDTRPPTTEDEATRLLQDLNYLCDAISEYAERRSNEGQHGLALEMRKALADARAMFPRDGDIEMVLSNPSVSRNCRQGVQELHQALRRAGIVVEGEALEEERVDELFGLSKGDKAKKAAGVLLQAAKGQIDHVQQDRETVRRAQGIDAICAGLYEHDDVFKAAGMQVDVEIGKLLGRDSGRGSANMGAHLRGNFYVQNEWAEGRQGFITMRTLYGAEALLGESLANHFEIDPWKPAPEGSKRPNIKIDNAWAVHRKGWDGHTYVYFSKRGY